MGKRRLGTEIKKQAVRAIVHLDNKFNEIPLELVFKEEVVPPEYKKKVGNFLGYTTIFEALEVASHDENFFYIIYQSQMHPEIPRTERTDWFGRFHVYKVNKKSSSKINFDLEVLPDSLPPNAIRARVLTLNKTNISELIAKANKKSQPRYSRKGHEKNDKRKAALVEIINLAGLILKTKYLTSEDLHKPFFSRDSNNLADLSFKGPNTKYTNVNQQKINLAIGIRGNGQTVSVETYFKLIRVNVSTPLVRYSTVMYSKKVPKSGLSGFAICVAPSRVKKGMRYLLSTLHHEALHYLQAHKTKNKVDMWRKSGSKLSLVKWSQEHEKLGRVGFTVLQSELLILFSISNKELSIIGRNYSELNALNEIFVYLEQFRIFLWRRSWKLHSGGGKQGKGEVESQINSAGYSHYSWLVHEKAGLRTQKALKEIISEWKPKFLLRFRAISVSRQKEVMQMLESLAGGNSYGQALSVLLLDTINGF